MSIRNVFLAAVVAILTISAIAQNQSQVDVEPFIAVLDVNGNGSISREEWKEMGLMDMSFALCDPNKDDSIIKEEMSACAIPEAMDPKREGILTVYSGGRFVIPSPGKPIPKPAKAPPGILQATQFVSDSPYVEGGPTGQDFIKMFDEDGDGNVGHMEWEMKKNSTVFKPYRWPQYNKNRDEWITVDEAPQPPAK